MMIGATPLPDYAVVAATARAHPQTWVRVPADLCTPGLLADVQHDRVADLPAERFAARTVAGVSFLGPRLDVEVRYMR